MADYASLVRPTALSVASRYSLSPPSPKGGRLRLIDFPIEKIIIASPGVDLASANLTSEVSRLLVCMLFSGRGVRHPAIGTAKIFDGPDVAYHPATMRRTGHRFQPRSLPQSMPSYSNPRIRRVFDSVFLTPKVLEPPRRYLGVSHSRLDGAVSQVSLPSRRGVSNGPAQGAARSHAPAEPASLSLPEAGLRFANSPCELNHVARLIFCRNQSSSYA